MFPSVYGFCGKTIGHKSELNETIQNMFKKHFRLLQARTVLKGATRGLLTVSL